MSETEPVHYAVADGVATITIDRPERKNALVCRGDEWPDRRVGPCRGRPVCALVVLTSSDCGVFSAGLDLKQAAEIRSRDGVDILTLMRDPMQTAMRSVSKPIIAAMTGSLMAGGMLLALKSDLRADCAGRVPVLPKLKWGAGRPGLCRYCGCCRSRY